MKIWDGQNEEIPSGGGGQIGGTTRSAQNGHPHVEVDPGIISDIHDALNSMLHSTATENLSNWLSLCREVLTVHTNEEPIGK